MLPQGMPQHKVRLRVVRSRSRYILGQHVMKCVFRKNMEEPMGLFDDAVPGGNIAKPLLVALGVLLAGKIFSSKSTGESADNEAPPPAGPVPDRRTPQADAPAPRDAGPDTRPAGKDSGGLLDGLGDLLDNLGKTGQRET